MRGIAAVVVCVAVGSAAALLAQERPQESPLLALGANAGAWVVEVDQRGGITGRGRGDVAVGSDARLACRRQTCREAVDGERAARVAAQIPDPEAVVWKATLPAVHCNDCIETTVTVLRRASDGTELRVALTWNELQARDVADEIRRLAMAVTSLAADAPPVRE